MAFGQPAKATPLGGEVYTDIGVTFEAPIHAILGDTGYSLSRISDNADAIWEVFNAEAQVRAIARQAGYANTFGVIATDGAQAGEFQSLFTARDGTNWQSNDEPWVDLGSLFGAGETFMLAIQTPHRTFSSADSLNADGLDHMVTWVDDDDPYHYFVGFEDSPGGGDADFNDLVVELKLVIDGPLVPPVSGPATTFADATGTRLPVDTDNSNGFAIGDVDGINGPDVVVANNGQTRLLINDGSSVFTDETGARLPRCRRRQWRPSWPTSMGTAISTCSSPTRSVSIPLS